MQSKLIDVKNWNNGIPALFYHKNFNILSYEASEANASSNILSEYDGSCLSSSILMASEE